MDNNAIREAVDYFNDKSGKTLEDRLDKFTHIDILVELAETYLACSGKMPEKKECCEMIDGTCGNHMGLCSQCYRNNAIDACTLATTKMLAEKDEEIARLRKIISDARETAQALHDRMIGVKHE